MGYLDITDLIHFTKFDKNTCLCVLGMIQRECGEIGIRFAEDNVVCVHVYRDYFEDPTTVIENEQMILKLVNKYDDPAFTLCYEIKLKEAKE